MVQVKNIRIALLMLVALVLAACSSDDVAPTAVHGVSDRYITLSLNTSAATRAASDHPTGGQDGDGSEYGRNFENSIDNLCIFIYEDVSGTNAGINGAASTPVKAKYYFSGLGLSLPNGSAYKTNPMKISGYEPSDNDRLIIFTNTGDVTSQFSTLGDFQSADKVWAKSQLWNDNADPSKCNNFVMTSSKDDTTYGKMNVAGKDGSYSDPFNAEVEIQRAMARVDIMYKDANKATVADGPLTFNVDASTAGSEDNAGTLKIIKIRLFNIPQASTFPLKRVANTADKTGLDGAKLLGEETTTNYVHTKWTYDKEQEDYGTETTFEKSTEVDANGIASYLPDGNTNYNVRAYPADNEVFTVNETDFSDFKYSYTVGYCTENTMPLDKQTENYKTGLLVRGTYIPNKIYTTADGTTLTQVTTYTEGTTFWRYVSRTASIPSRFFLTEEDLDRFVAKNSGKYDKVKYTQGQCYYYIWIKHQAPASVAAENTTPMEYAIVRNNIYRIGIDKVTGIGGYEPNPDDHIYSKVYVRDWRFRGLAEIIL